MIKFFFFLNALKARLFPIDIASYQTVYNRGIQKLRIKKKIKSVSIGYSDSVIGIKDISFKGFQLRLDAFKICMSMCIRNILNLCKKSA